MKLLITDKVDETKLTPLKKYFQIDKRVGISQENLSKVISGYDCIITRSQTAISRDLINDAKKLKIIARAGIGVDNIDIFAATDKKIAVVNAPKGYAKAAAIHTIKLLFKLLSKNNRTQQIVGKILGIVGFGNVGREVFRIARKLGLRVIVCEPYVHLPKEVEKVTFEELLKLSDVISFHVPLTYLTKQMINRYTISLCKKGVYIINRSRGEVVDEKVVLAGLNSGKIAGFAFDIYHNEPPTQQNLVAHPNVIAISGIAGISIKSISKNTQEVVSAMLQYLNGKIPVNLLNPQVFRKNKKRIKIRLNFDSIIFDCDSTISTIEGIDELANIVDMKKDIAKLTRDAMEGIIPLEDVFERRLELVRPSREHLNILARLYIENLVEDAKGVVEALNFLGKNVYIVSGGFSHALYKLGQYLGIPTQNIFGNDLVFDREGNYKTYIHGPLKRNNGKLQIVKQISGKKLFVGDSITDLETINCVDLFVGYGGVAKRSKVEQESEVFLRTQSFAPILIIAAGFDGCVKLLSTKYKRYVGKGLDLLSHSLHTKVEKTMLSNFSEFKQLAHY